MQPCVVVRVSQTHHRIVVSVSECVISDSIINQRRFDIRERIFQRRSHLAAVTVDPFNEIVSDLCDLPECLFIVVNACIVDHLDHVRRNVELFPQRGECFVHVFEKILNDLVVHRIFEFDRQLGDVCVILTRNNTCQPETQCGIVRVPLFE